MRRDCLRQRTGRAFGTGAHATTRLCLELLLDLPRGPLLDIGCSWGRWSLAAARKGYSVVGIDPSLGAVMAARRIKITYEASDRPRGAEVRIRTTDSAAVAAIHAFLAFQRTAHHAAR